MDNIMEYFKILYNEFENLDKINNISTKFIKLYRYKKIVNNIKDIVNNSFSSDTIKVILLFKDIIRSKGIDGYIPNKYGFHPRMKAVKFTNLNSIESLEEVEYNIDNNTFSIVFSNFSFTINDTNITNNILKSRWEEVDKCIKDILVNTILDIGQFADLIVHQSNGG